MRNPNRIEPVLSQLRAYWEMHPDLRLGQILVNAVTHGLGKSEDSLFAIEDLELLVGIWRLRIANARRCCRTHWQQDTGYAKESNTPGMGFMLCAICGHKRCPKATNCELACTDSNEPGQPGSIF